MARLLGDKVNDLIEWLRDYMAADLDGMGMNHTVLNAVEQDELVWKHIEHGIHQSRKKLIVWEGHCNFCLALFQKWPTIDAQTATHVTHGFFESVCQIEAAANMGCRSCAFFRSRLSFGGLLILFHQIDYRISLFKPPRPRFITLCIRVWNSDRMDSQLIWLNFPGKMITNCNSGCAMSTEFESNVLPSHTPLRIEPDKYQLARGWLSECKGKHIGCGSECCEAFARPTRLVRIIEDVIKVEETKMWEAMPPYATLSYCWGRRPFLKLIAGSRQQLSKGISSETMPKGFLNAVLIARKLGLDYIWIDALCIMQDASNTEDWLAELGLMKDIYSGGYINIAFNSATSVYEDCFTQPVPYSGGFVSRVTLDDHCRVQSFHPTGAYDEATAEEHLATRAWTFQERLLARRTLSIGRTGWFWECRSHTASEYLPHGYPGMTYSRLMRPQNAAWPWDQIIGIYSKASLTQPSDKLPALSGIAQAQHDITGDTYLAGMWREDLIKQLGWKCVKRCPRPPYRAPSWSWASVDGSIESMLPLQGEIVHEYSLVHAVDVISINANPFGPVRGGFLQLSCTTLLSGTLHEIADSEAVDWQGGKVSLDYDQKPYCISLDCSFSETLAGGTRIYMTPLFSGERYHEIELGKAANNTAVETSQLICGMVLQRKSQDDSSFQRVGCFHFYSLADLDEDHPQTSEFYHRFMAAMNDPMLEASKAVLADAGDSASSTQTQVILTIM